MYKYKLQIYRYILIFISKDKSKHVFFYRSVTKVLRYPLFKHSRGLDSWFYSLFFLSGHVYWAYSGNSWSTFFLGWIVLEKSCCFRIIICYKSRHKSHFLKEQADFEHLCLFFLKSASAVAWKKGINFHINHNFFHF